MAPLRTAHAPKRQRLSKDVLGPPKPPSGWGSGGVASSVYIARGPGRGARSLSGVSAIRRRVQSTRTRVRLRVRSGPPHDLIGISALERQLDNLDRIRWLRYHRFRPPMTQYYSHMNTVVSCEQFWEPLGRAISAKIGTLLPHRRSGRRARFRLSRGVESSRPPASTFALPKSRE